MHSSKTYDNRILVAYTLYFSNMRPHLMFGMAIRANVIKQQTQNQNQQINTEHQQIMNITKNKQTSANTFNKHKESIKTTKANTK